MWDNVIEKTEFLIDKYWNDQTLSQNERTNLMEVLNSMIGFVRLKFKSIYDDFIANKILFLDIVKKQRNAETTKAIWDISEYLKNPAYKIKNP